MSMIQIRNVPEELHRELKTRAANSGQTLSDYLLGELESLARRPTLREWLEEVRRTEPARLRMSPSAAIAAERGRGE
jgi:plasmid stability protein